jgi:pilus assembly protein Flp/PilA
MDNSVTPNFATTISTWTAQLVAQLVARRSHQRAESGERAATLVEYALLVALIAVLCIGSVRYLGGTASSGISSNASSMFGP